ncbi:MAG: tRNA nucleotidyltransferase [Clostridiales bacterium]|nr:tRNA nucleotidyltransferase [Clostridiales bacterium]
MDQNLMMAKQLATAVADAGGRAYFVGGFVRDFVMHRPCKDIDVEVHNLTPAQLEALLDSLGERTIMGASFGIYGLRHYDLDIAMPRSETNTGRGHKDFTVCVDPFLGTRKAALRRDFTINAMMQDVLTGEIIDHFGGQADLKAGIIRHVNDESFGEDPLRVLRAAQFAARFEFEVAPETVAICKTMDLTALAGERIMEELNKALLKAAKPSIFFDVLRQMDQLDCWFPEVSALIGVEQEPRFHPEGDVYTHTMMVLDQAATLRDQAIHPRGLMLSALCHDFGKPETTKEIDGRIRSFGHEQVGCPLSIHFINRMNNEVRLKKYVENMVLLHMRPNALVHMKSGSKAYMKLFDLSQEPADLLLLAQADHCGRDGFGDDYDEIAQVLRHQLAAYQALMNEPEVKGEDLIQAGVKPGKLMGQAIAYAHKLHLSGIKHDAALVQTLAWLHENEKK